MKRILFDGIFTDETRVAVVDNGILQDYDREDIYFKQQIGNIYLAEVTKVEHSLQAAFLNYGGDRHGFLPFGDIHPDYLNVPVGKEKDLSAIACLNVGMESVAPPRDAKIKEGQYVIVQVVKDERGAKGVAMTTYITLASKYSVLLCNSDAGGGISKKVVNLNERRLLREKLQNLNVPKGMSVILRTAVKEGEEDSIERDYKYLTKLWDVIIASAINTAKPCFLHSEEDIVKRTIRDITNNTVDEIIVEGQAVYDKVKQSLELVYGNSHLPLNLHKGVPLFQEYKVEEQITELYNNKVILPSGASMVIDITEALVSIDINSGKSIKGSNVNETALQTNLEAAKEIGRQLKLRDLAGIVVVDFIDMEQEKDRRAVENAMWQATKGDKARVQIARISQFGLLELSRQRLNTSQRERVNEICSCCNGSGRVKSKDIVAMNILRDVKSAIMDDKINVITISTNRDMIGHLINFRRKEINSLENGYDISIMIETENLPDNEYKIRKRQFLTDEEKKRLNNKQDIECNVIENLAEYRMNREKREQQEKEQLKKKQQQRIHAQQVNNKKWNNNRHNTNITSNSKSHIKENKKEGSWSKIKSLFGFKK